MIAIEVRALKPSAAPIVLEQCAGTIIGIQPAYRLKDGTQCFRRSQYAVDGKNYCAFHAGRILLDLALAGRLELMPHVPDANPTPKDPSDNPKPMSGET